MLTPGHASSSQSDWTSARCARLLRHITVSLNALRRLNTSTGACVKSKEHSVDSNSRVHSSKNNTEFDSLDGDSFRPKVTTDPDWIPENHPQSLGKKTSRQYSRYGARSKVRTIAQAYAVIELKTPQLKRFAESQMDLTPSWTPEMGDVSLGAAAPSKWRNIFSNSQDAHEIQLSKLDRGMRELLRATDVDVAREDPSGCPSLMSMCLRNIPQLIKLEENAQLFAAKTEQTDVTASVLEYLEETHGISSRGGWKHLRTVVREHGIQLLINAVHEGIVPADNLRRLAFDLLHNVRSVENQRQARRDGINLLQAAVLEESQTERPSSVASPALQILVAVTRSWDAAERREFRYELMTRMLTDGTLGIEDILSPSTHAFWKSALLRLHHKVDGANSATLFLRAIILVACGLFRDGTPPMVATNHQATPPLAMIRKALTTILTTLTAFVLNGQRSTSQVSVVEHKLAADRSRWILSDATNELVRYRLENLEKNMSATVQSLNLNAKIVADTTFLCIAAHRGGAPDVSDCHLRRILCIGRGVNIGDPAMAQTNRQVRLSKQVSRALGRMRGVDLGNSMRDFVDRLLAMCVSTAAGSLSVAGHIGNLAKVLLAFPDDESLSMPRPSSRKARAKCRSALQGFDASRCYRQHVGVRLVAESLWEEAELEFDEGASFEDPSSSDASDDDDVESLLASEQQSEELKINLERPTHLAFFKSSVDSPDPLFSAKRPSLQQKDSDRLVKRNHDVVPAQDQYESVVALPTWQPFTNQTPDELCKTSPHVSLRDHEIALSSKRGTDDCSDETEWSFISTSSDDSVVSGYKRRRLDNKRRSRSLFSSLSKKYDRHVQGSEGFSDMDELSFMDC